jgi:hypothetical protein
MLRRLSIRCLLVPAILVLGLHREMEAQCVVFKVTVDGEVHSASKDTQVLVRIHANRGKKVSEATATPEGGRFHIAVGFDTFVSVHLFGAHNCSRQPTAIDATLLVGGAPKQTVELSLERDFNFDKKLAEWHTKVPVVLGGDATSSSIMAIGHDVGVWRR